jgi:predicted methyltransferase MtxX (methanogen marker protein 4)
LPTGQILHEIEKFIKKSASNICIGLGEDKAQNKKISAICEEFSRKFDLTIILIRREDSEKKSDLKDVAEKLVAKIRGFKGKGKIFNINTDRPERLLLNLVFFGDNFSGIRGSLPSSKFLSSLKSIFNSQFNKTPTFSRIALLETAEGDQFFFAPVGIDEAKTMKSKTKVIRYADKLIKLLRLEPKVSVLSGGRAGDTGRDTRVDQLMKEAQELEKLFKDEDLKLYNEQILIENAIKRKSSFILAPEGISGNLIYRTLVHLGNGKAYGALYASIFFDFNKILIDCSRIAKTTEILGSLILSAGFSGLIQK